MITAIDDFLPKEILQKKRRRKRGSEGLRECRMNYTSFPGKNTQNGGMQGLAIRCPLCCASQDPSSPKMRRNPSDYQLRRFRASCHRHASDLQQLRGQVPLILQNLFCKGALHDSTRLVYLAQSESLISPKLKKWSQYQRDLKI